MQLDSHHELRVRSATRPARPVILVASEDTAVRNSMQATIGYAKWEVRTFEDAATLLSSARTSGPACLLLDLNLPDIADLDLAVLMDERRHLPVICVADNPSVRTTVRAMKTGAIEFLTKPLDEQLLLDAIDQALQLSSARLVRAAAIHGLQQRFSLLSRRERQVMQLVVAGRLNKHVAEDLGISEITVKAHRGKVMRKMRAASLPHLVNMAAELRIGSSHPRNERIRPAPAFVSLPALGCV